MVRIYLKEKGAIKCLELKELSDEKLPKGIIWADLISSTGEEKKFIEKMFSVELFTRQEIEEIESSSKYIEDDDEIGININFLNATADGFTSEPVSFILTKRVLITQRPSELRTFTETTRKLNALKPEDGDDVFLTILETRIDFDADLIESITEQISAISKDLVTENQLDRKLLFRISTLQDATISIRENIVAKQRIISSILKSKFFPREDYETIRIMIQDVSSLLDHSAFNFERLEFLQNTFLGLVDMEQNRVIKIFTVVTVVFMPPTLIASMYGMNFHFMPELDEVWGYPFALLLMLFSSAGTLFFFKYKKWL